ncbi:MAG TPA: FAD-binding oxidoreductase, partial [Anaerolineaceae bacterium]|nr:FAD-binding oxidoreductase [Anaerolineaceae bacterium]
AKFLENLVGRGCAGPDADLQTILTRIPPSRLPDHPLVTKDPETRLRHARGQSLPDWVALRSGEIETFPDGVAFPESDEEVQQLFAYAAACGAQIIPYGGGSSVVGHLNVRAGDPPALSVDMCRMDALLDLDETSLLATFGAGVRGPDLEEALNQRGYTLGHFPQSFEFSTLGGWIASRSVGTQCYYYGRIENLFASGHIETPSGALDLPLVPASAAGPDLRHLVMGSEGRIGIITRATVRIARLPQDEHFHAVFFPDWVHGLAALREIVQERVPVSMLRLSNPAETETTLQLAGKPKLVDLAHRGLNLIGIREERCMLMFGATGDKGKTGLAYRRAAGISRAHKGFVVNPVIGKMWHKTRFTTPYLRNTLWDFGYALDTLESALPWSKVDRAIQQAITCMQNALEPFGERAHVFAHLSHMYSDGASFYITYLFRQARDADDLLLPEETLRRWHAIKDAASRVIVDHGGTISHQHGIGLDHAPYLRAEKGALGMQTLNTLFHQFDPDEMMNKGKLIVDS